MSRSPAPSASRVRELPTPPSLEHLRNAAKHRRKALREKDPRAKLADAQVAVARDYGFASWRQLKAHVDKITRKRVFTAARAGDVDTVRRALQSGFDPSLT